MTIILSKSHPPFTRGVVLMSTLWVLVLLSVLALGLAKRLSYSTAVTRNRMQREVAVEAVRSGLLFAMATLEDDEDHDIDSVLDMTYDNPKLFSNQALSGGVTFSISHLSEEKITYGFEFLNSKLNLNHLDKKMVSRIIEDMDIDEEQMAAMLDWIDTDNDPNNRGDGAESDYYQDLDPPLSPPNQAIYSWVDLFMVKDMDEEFATFLKTHFTLYGDGKVNLNIAERKTLEWLGFSEILIDKIERYRMGFDDVPGTEDDQIFENMNELIPKLNEYESLYPDEVAELTQALGFLTLNTPTYRIQVMASIADTVYPYRLQAILQRSEGTAQALRIVETEL